MIFKGFSLYNLFPYRLLFFLLLISTFIGVSGQSSRTIRGVVKDSITQELLSFIAVQVDKSTVGTTTDDNGAFTLEIPSSGKVLTISSVGYKTKEVKIPSSTSAITILLSSTSFVLKEVVVTSGREKYTKKENPAVILMRKVIAHKEKNRIEAIDFYQREVYEKTRLGFTDFKIKPSGKTGISEIIQNADTSPVSKKPILILSLKERICDEYYSAKPWNNKTIVKAQRSSGIDDAVFQEGMVETYLGNLFREIDIYNSNIIISNKPFVSPLSPIAPDFYKFYLKDTVEIEGQKCVQVDFGPFNSAQFGFTGTLDITLDSLWAVKRVKVNVPRNTNINFLEYLQLEQEFSRNEEGYMQIKQDNLIAEFYIFQGLQGIFVEKTRGFKDYLYHQNNDSVMKAIRGDVLILQEATHKADTFWQDSRHIALEGNELKIESLLDNLMKNPLVKVLVKTAEILVKGYVSTGKQSKFDIGPVYTMLSGSDIEGTRFRLGGETTANLHPRLFAYGYLAFGTNDHKIKYGGTLEYSFIEKKYHAREFPVHSLMLTAKDDIVTLGESPAGTLTDNLFYSIKRMRITNMEYQKSMELKYTWEDRSGFSIFAWAKYMREDPAGSIFFKTNQLINNGRTQGVSQYLPFLTTSEIGLTLRYAPKEKFVQGRIYRFNMKNPHPVFELSHYSGIKDLFGADYGYQKTEFKYQQRFFFSAFGRLDVTAKAGKIWTGDVAFPYLLTPNANTSFTVMDDSYSQVNPLEFVGDQYLSLDLGLYTNGLLFNLIPGIKKLKLREVAGFKLYWSHLSNKNNPQYNANVLAFPTYTAPMSMEPYMEFSVGIDNIFSILRVDYVRRINYLNRPGIQADGIRVSLNFTF